MYLSHGMAEFTPILCHPSETINRGQLRIENFRSGRGGGTYYWKKIEFSPKKQAPNPPPQKKKL